MFNSCVTNYRRAVLLSLISTINHPKPLSTMACPYQRWGGLLNIAIEENGMKWGWTLVLPNINHGIITIHSIIAINIYPLPISWNFRGEYPQTFLEIISVPTPPFQFWKVFNLSYFSFFPTFSDIMERIVPCMHTFIHTYMHACIHACMHAYIHAYINHY